MEIDLGDVTISSLALSPDFIRAPFCFAGTEQGLLVSRDAGSTWEDAFTSLGLGEPLAITTVLCVPRPDKATLVIAGTVGGFLRSEDVGRTWQVIPAGSPPPVITALAASRSAGLYAGSADDGIFVSQDGGLQWVRWNFGLLDWHIFSLLIIEDPAGNDTIFAGTETGLFSSTNRGRSWREVDFPIDACAVLALGASKDSRASYLFAGTESGALFCSTDRGVSWGQISIGTFNSEISALVASGNRVLAASGNNLFYSENNGGAWQAWNPQAPVSEAIMALAVPGQLEPASTVFAGTTGKIYLIPGATGLLA